MTGASSDIGSMSSVYNPGHAQPQVWPEGFGRLLGSSLPSQILEVIGEEAQAVSESPNFWTSRVGLDSIFMCRSSCSMACIVLLVRIVDLSSRRNDSETMQHPSQHARQQSGTWSPHTCSTCCQTAGLAQNGGCRWALSWCSGGILIHRPHRMQLHHASHHLMASGPELC